MMKKQNSGLSSRFSIVLFLTVSFWQNSVVAHEGSFYEGARTWKTIYSLIGESLENAKKIVKNNGLVLYNNGKDEKSGIEAYNFVRANSKSPENENPYTIGFKGNKVVMLMVPYEYSDEKNINIEKDLNEIKKQLKATGFELTDEKTEEHSGMGSKWTESTYFYNKPNQNNEVRIFQDTSMGSFNLMFFENKYSDLFKMD